MGSSSKCWKCSFPAPEPGSKEAVRWKCPDCSTDDFTICGSVYTCPDCNRDYDRDTDEWFELQIPTERSTSAGGSAGGAGASVPKKKRKRAGRRHKKGVAQSSDPRQEEPDADADYPSTEEYEEEAPEAPPPWRRTRSNVVSGGRRIAAPMAVVCAAALPTVVDAVDVFQPTTVLAVGFVTVIGFMSRRSYEASDTVVGAVEASTVEFVEAVGHESTKVVPVLVGILITLLLVLLRMTVQKCWTTRKERRSPRKSLD